MSTRDGDGQASETTLRGALHAALCRAVEKARGSGALTTAPGEADEFWVKCPPRPRQHTLRTRNADFASNVALVLAASTGTAPRTVAHALMAHLEPADWMGEVEEENGFLNFRMDDELLTRQVERALDEGERYGQGTALAGLRVNVEFVSSDPSGPLSLAAGRLAAAGDALCRILSLQGADVTREFFWNDAESSLKMRLLGESVAAFYLAAFGHEAEPPEGMLDDAFVRGVARDIAAREGNSYLLVPDSERIAAFARVACQAAMAAQKQALRDFGVRIDVWTSENALRQEGRVRSAIHKLQDLGHTYHRDGALWLRTTDFGDEADRPLTRPAAGAPDGEPTYLATDIAYHIFKFERGFDLLLNIWTAEHQPYITRTRAALRAAGCRFADVEVLPCQGARWLHDGTPVAHGKAGGPFTLDEALHEVNCDTLRFWLLRRDWDATVDIDIEMARRDAESNPAYAARLAPARLSTMIGEWEARLNASRAAASRPDAVGDGSTSSDQGSDRASTPAWSAEERELARLMAVWPDTVETAARQREPRRVAQFVTQIAGAVRAVLAAARPGAASERAPDTPGGVAEARLQLLRAARVTVTNALHLLGMDASTRL
jgi:arginyl-tRNA synthetase